MKLKESVLADFGQVDIVVNCAGITRDATFKKITPAHWAAVMKTNLDSVFNVTHQFVNEIVSFLASDNAGFITGANISANGGQFIH